MSRWALRSRRIVLADGMFAGAIVVGEDGRVVELTTAAQAAPMEVDCGDDVVSPGLVDCHVHINEPGRTEWEGYTTATRAAAAGGVTTLVDMPLNCIPATVSAAAFATKLAACSGQLHVDVGFWGGVVPHNLAELAPLAQAGVLGCKAFLVDSGVQEFPHVSEAQLRQALPVLRDLGLPLLAHAELDLGAEVAESDPRSYRGYLQSRPAAWEDAAIRLLIGLCRETGCSVHVVHLSAASSLPLLAAAKVEGLPLTVETCPHYLCFEAECIPDGDTLYKCAPPIREHANREALWAGLLAGTIDFVVTDHSPCLPGLKDVEGGHFHEAWGGIASLQLGLPALWSEASVRGATLNQLAQWTAERPAAFAGLAASKGRIAPGWDADFVVWDPAQRWTVSAEQLLVKHRQQSPYIGRELSGQVHRCFLRGLTVFDRQAPQAALQGGFPAVPKGRPLLGRSAVTVAGL